MNKDIAMQIINIRKLEHAKDVALNMIRSHGTIAHHHQYGETVGQLLSKKIELLELGYDYSDELLNEALKFMRNE